jgi:FkbM family methyltransferase
VNYDSSQAAQQHKFAPAEEDKHNWLKSLNIRTVLDIGANTGQFAAEIHTILPEAMIYSFEPLKDCYQSLVESMKHVQRFRAFDFALGEEDLEIEMHRSEFSPSSSILPMGDLHKEAFPFTSGEMLEKIKVKRLDDITGSLNLVDNLLIKIDVQGFEDRVIAGGRQTIERARVLIVETSFRRLYEGQPLFDTIYDMLRQMGFAYHGNFIQLLNPVDGSVLQADGIFMKANEQAAIA